RAIPRTVSHGAPRRWRRTAPGSGGLPGGTGQRPGGRPSGRGDVGQTVDEGVDGVLGAFDSGAVVVGEGNLDEHSLQAGLGFEQLSAAGGLGEVEVAAGAGHPVRALLEEGVAAVAVAEVVILERDGPAGDRVAVE